MAESKVEKGGARPSSGRAFLKCQCLTVPDVKSQLIFWPLLVIGLVLDLWSKNAVFSWLRQRHGSFTVIDGFLQLVTAENSGAAFGIATGHRWLLVVVSVVALVVVLAVFLFGGIERRVIHIALGLFAGGVCGNLWDRIFNDGWVRDFIDVTYWPGRHWPAFNIADSMLCISVGLLIISSLFTEKLSQKHAQQHK